MVKHTRVNFHCHSDLSDGIHSPEVVARILARDGAQFAALTDHDSTAGLARFREAAEREGLCVVSGVEITAHHQKRELHLLAYGFNSEDEALQEALKAVRRSRSAGFHPAIDSLREPAAAEAAQGEQNPAAALECARAIELVHEAGGLAFLAHPLFTAPEPADLDRLVSELAEAGLDGIEAYYGPYPSDARKNLATLAESHGLLVCGGSDFHGNEPPPRGPLAVEIPAPLWKAFRDVVLLPAASAKHGKPPREVAASPPRFRRRQFFLRIMVPALLTVALFLVALLGIFIPATEEALLARKRDATKDLTAAAVSILDEYRSEAEAGEMAEGDAQRLALERLRNMRYGVERKDYFWVTDMHPRMLMHPYRADLEGEDLTTFRDEQGKQVFVAFVDAVSDDGEGFVEYMWQWKDDPARVAPKLSYVRRYDPWGWVVGTGIYLDDVESEIGNLTDNLIRICLAIVVLVTLLLFLIAQQSLKTERQRRRAEEALRYSHEKYRTLVESAGHGSLMVLEGRCAYANAPMLELLGYTEEELRLHDLHDLLPNAKPEENETVRHFEDLLEGRPAPTAWQGELRRRDGAAVHAALSVRTVALNDRTGLVVTIGEPEHAPGRRHAQHATAEDRRFVQDLHASLLFLNEPIQPYLRAPLSCPLNTSIRDAAALMEKDDASALLVVAEGGDPVGIVTDADLRARVIAAGTDAKRPVFEIMSSPIVFVDEQTLVFQAMLTMQDRRVQHLVARDANGAVTGIVRNRDLLQFSRYASAVVSREIGRATAPEEIVAARRRVPAMVASLLEAGARPQSVMRIMGSVHDATADKLLRLAMDRLGPPPVRFAFVCMGSQGRQEETLVTDQDNGIIYKDAEGEADRHVAEYFEKLGRQVCEWLDAVGYDFCPGGIMASNGLWRGPLSQWQDRLGEWMAAAEPSDLLKFDMVFDFRCVYGAAELAAGLRRFVFDRAKQDPAFLMHFARNTLQYKPPLGWFGQVGARAGSEGRMVNLKDAMMCVAKFARIYAVREGFAETNTLDRLDRMAKVGLLSEEGHEESVAAYELLMRLRLKHQAAAIAAGVAPDNTVAVAELTHIDAKALREAFNQIATLQKHLSYDFLGVDQT